MKKPITIKIDKNILKKLDALAQNDNRTRTNMIEYIILKAWENDKGSMD